MRLVLKVYGILGLCCLVAATPALAANPDYEAWMNSATATRGGSDNEWQINLGIGFGFAPDYLGSDDNGAHYMPLIDIEWRGAYFLSTQRGLGVNLVRKRNTKAGPRLTRSSERKSSENSDLQGMKNLGASYEIGAFVQHFSGSWRWDGDIRYGLNSSGHQGVLMGAGLALGGRLSDRSSLLIGGNFHYAGEDYMIANFGVLASEARAGRNAYTPGGGIRDIGGWASIIYAVTDQVYLTLDGRGLQLMGQAADSPLTKAAEQYFVGSTLGIRF